MKVILQEGRHYILRFDRGEEVIEEIKKFCETQQIGAGAFEGIGLANEVWLAFYDIVQKEYKKQVLKEEVEINGFFGNIARKEGELIVHAHGTFSRENLEVKGGHIEKVFVSATCEVFLEKLEGTIKRRYSPEIGLNLMQ